MVQAVTMSEIKFKRQLIHAFPSLVLGKAKGVLYVAEDGILSNVVLTVVLYSHDYGMFGIEESDNNLSIFTLAHTGV